MKQMQTINYIKQYFKTLKINSNQSESNIDVNIVIKQLIKLHEYDRMKGGLIRGKGGAKMIYIGILVACIGIGICVKALLKLK